MLVSDSIQDAEQQTKAILNSSRRDKSSQLASISILFIEASGEALNIGLKVITGDGESASIAVPFPQSDLAINA